MKKSKKNKNKSSIPQMCHISIMHLHPQNSLKTLTPGIVTVVPKRPSPSFAGSFTHPPQPPTHWQLSAVRHDHQSPTAHRLPCDAVVGTSVAWLTEGMAYGFGWKNSIMCRKGSKYINIEKSSLSESSTCCTRKGACNFLKSTTTILESWKHGSFECLKNHKWNSVEARNFDSRAGGVSADCF